MLIGRKFNELLAEEYTAVIDNYKYYSDFNTLGLYRSLTENTKLSLAEKLSIRNHANELFKKSFDFLQLKDPETYVNVLTIGEELTVADLEKIWDEVKKSQQRILSDKRIKHRNFGVYSKHSCPYDDCIYQGLMVRPKSQLAYGCISFDSDEDRYVKATKSKREKANRKREKTLIQEEIFNN